MLVRNGWQLFAHPLFLDQVERIVDAVEREGQKDPAGYASTPNGKLLAAIRYLIFEAIPSNPSRSSYRQGETLGARQKHWFRAKFGNGRFRLFFRFESRSRVIIYALVNDSETLRTYGAKTDAYAVFRRMLEDGRPPDDWPSLLVEAGAAATQDRLSGVQEEPKA